MSEFVFLYRGGQRASDAAESDKVMQKWVAWMEDLGSKGHLKDRGQPLDPGGKVVRGKYKQVTDGPYAEAKDVVGGYIIVDTPDLAHAVDLSKGCPILEVGGSVEVRPVQKLSM